MSGGFYKIFALGVPPKTPLFVGWTYFERKSRK
jgi:hypothetical protein